MGVQWGDGGGEGGGGSHIYHLIPNFGRIRTCCGAPKCHIITLLINSVKSAVTKALCDVS